MSKCDMNEPYRQLSPGEMAGVDLSTVQMSGGVRLLGAMLPTPQGPMACLVFSFARPDGSGFYPPTLLALPDDEMEGLLVLVAQATESAVSTARHHRRPNGA